MRKPELLSPAGNMDCLHAAVGNGTDAVYLGIREFNARLNAKNFTLPELGQAVRFCHEKGVRVYLTLNTLVKNHEIKSFFNVLSQAYLLGIDGVIIQEISLLKIIKENYPGLSVFISTQAAIGNASSASLLKSADRIILPRELPLDEIKKIKSSGVNVEVFVHGALCFGYSGLCLFSSFVDNRSGNRGACAQLCRQKYNGSYPLSTKELCLARKIPELIEAGISGFKIEGRMRSPLYVAVATRLYRKAIDSYFSGKFIIPEKELAEIEVVFNREFTEGFAFGSNDLISPEKPMNRGAFIGIVENGQISANRHIALGDGIGIWSNNSVNGLVLKELIINGEKTKSVSAGQRFSTGFELEEGAKIYLTSSRQIKIEPEFNLKRPSITLPKRNKIEAKIPAITPRKNHSLKLLVKVYSLQEAEDARQAGAGTVFYNIFAADFPEKPGSSLGAYIPRILNDELLERSLELLRKKKPAAIMTGNLGFIAHRRDYALPVYLDYALNSFNDLDLLFYHKHEVIPMLSPELSLSELAEFKDKDAVVFCHGDIILVNTLIAIDNKRLVNDKGADFQIRKEAGYWQILNSRPFGLFNDILKLRAAGFNQFFIDQQNKGARVTALYLDILKHETSDRKLRKGYTSGHLYRPVA